MKKYTDSCKIICIFIWSNIYSTTITMQKKDVFMLISLVAFIAAFGILFIGASGWTFLNLEKDTLHFLLVALASIGFLSSILLLNTKRREYIKQGISEYTANSLLLKTSRRIFVFVLVIILFRESMNIYNGTMDYSRILTSIIIILFFVPIATYFRYNVLIKRVALGAD